MAIYNVIMEFQGQREILIVDNVHEDYGPEKTYFRVWLGRNKNHEGGGDTIEAAIEGLFHNWELRQHMMRIQEEMYHMMGTTNWYTSDLPAMTGLDAQLRAANG